MKTLSVPAVLACLSLLLLCGCDKEVELTFVNRTDQALDVRVSTPDEGHEHVGRLDPRGRLEHEIEIDDDELPARCSWTAGPYGGDFLVTEESDEEIWLEIFPAAVDSPVSPQPR